MALMINTEEALEVKVNGTSYQVKVPSLRQLAEIKKKSEAEDTDAMPSYYEDLFVTLGLPKEVSQKFSAKNWKVLIEELVESKKV